MKTRFTVARVATAAALCLLAPFTASPSLALDLVQSWERAQAGDPTMAAAREALAAGREKALQGRALLKPQVVASGSLAQTIDRSKTTLPPSLAQAAGAIDNDGTPRTHQIGLQLVQPLYDKKAEAERAQLGEQASLAEVQHAAAQQELILRVGERYFDLLLAEEALRVLRAERGAVTLQRDRAQARFDVGRGRVTELQEAQARLDSVAAREVSAEATLALRRAQYAELVGAPAGTPSPLAPGFAAAPPSPDSAEAWQQQAEAANPRVLLKQGELVIARAEAGKYSRSARPTLDLVASLSDRGRHGAGASLMPSSQRSASIGLQWSIPLYTAGALDARQREAAARHRQAEQELAAARRDARLQAQDQYLAVKTGVARIAALDQQLRSARTALEATTLGRDLGTRTELDVLDAQQRVFGTEEDLARARHQHLLGRLRLAAAAGSLSEGELRSLNTFLTRH